MRQSPKLRHWKVFEGIGLARLVVVVAEGGEALLTAILLSELASGEPSVRLEEGLSLGSMQPRVRYKKDLSGLELA
jgi:hypothetical protein